MAGFQILAASEAVMLGAPLFSEKTMDDVWEGHRASLELAGSRLINVNAHDSLVILKHSLSLPKLHFIYAAPSLLVILHYRYLMESLEI